MLEGNRVLNDMEHEQQHEARRAAEMGGDAAAGRRKAERERRGRERIKNDDSLREKWLGEPD